jgi:restriction endonuclease S subunit
MTASGMNNRTRELEN